MKERGIQKWRKIIEDQEKSGLTVYQYCTEHNLKPVEFNRHRKELKHFLKSNLFVDLGAPLHLFKSAPELSGRLTFDGITLKVARMDKFQLAKILEIIAAVRLEVPVIRDFPPSNDLAAIRKDSPDFLPVAAESNSSNP